MQLDEIAPAPLDVEVVLSPAWLTGALQVAFPGVRVAATQVVEVIETTARKVRLTVTYDETAGHDAPAALCLKGYFNPEYAQFAVTGCDRPKCVGACHSAARPDCSTEAEASLMPPGSTGCPTGYRRQSDARSRRSACHPRAARQEATEKRALRLP